MYMYLVTLLIVCKVFKPGRSKKVKEVMTDHVFPIMLYKMTTLIHCIDTELLQFFNKNNSPLPHP